VKSDLLNIDGLLVIVDFVLEMHADTGLEEGGICSVVLARKIELID